MMENVVMDKIKISLLFFVFFLAFLFSKTAQNNDFVPSNNTKIDIVNNKVSIVDKYYVVLTKIEEEKTQRYR
ncbi:MAG: hypothetical protein ACRCZ0_01920 [Cetobacterium sp.]